MRCWRCHVRRTLSGQSCRSLLGPSRRAAGSRWHESRASRRPGRVWRRGNDPYRPKADKCRATQLCPDRVAGFATSGLAQLCGVRLFRAARGGISPTLAPAVLRPSSDLPVPLRPSHPVRYHPARMSAVCPRCRAELGSAATVCPRCGARAGDASPTMTSPTPAKPTGARLVHHQERYASGVVIGDRYRIAGRLGADGASCWLDE